MAVVAWESALSPARLRAEGFVAEGDEGNEFLSDYIRVAFSSAFRRLQDKTQVSPLAETDFVRRRLTHSVEVAAVGERMGRVTAALLRDRFGTDYRDSFGKIVATAALLHDIGNPPFGHEGEMAIREWAAENGVDHPDYRCFDGNAQGFRIAVRLQSHGKDYGLDLTAPTLMASLKYPQMATMDDWDGGKCRGVSIMASEEPIYEKLRHLVALPKATRHPLCLLVEASDDIVNRLVDIEDAIKLKLITFDEMEGVIAGVQTEASTKLLQSLRERRREIEENGGTDPLQRAYQHFRAKCIIAMAKACEEAFIAEIDDIENGVIEKDLIERSDLGLLYSALKDLEYSKIFDDPSIVRIEAGGRSAIKGLLSIFFQALKDRSKLGKMVPEPPRFDGDPAESEELVRVRRVVDYVSGMTDRYAIGLYQELSGVSL